MQKYKLIFTKNGSDLTEGIEVRMCIDVFGWTSHEVWLTERGGEEWLEHKIGELYCGDPINLADGYGFRFEKEKAA
jgi:hypothetical protein